MARRYSKQEKQQALDALAAGSPLTRVASERGVSVSTLRRWQQAAGQGRAQDQRTTAPTAASVAVSLDRFQLLLIDTADALPKIAHILRNERLSHTITVLPEHPDFRHLQKQFLWATRCHVIDLDAGAARRVIDLVRRSGRELPGLLLVPDGQRADIEDQPLPVCIAAIGAAAPDLLGALLDREHRLHRQRLRIRECENQLQQLQSCHALALDTVTEPAAMICASGHRYANPAYRRLFESRAATRLEETPFTALVADSSMPVCLETLEQLRQPGASLIVDLEFQGGARARVRLTRLPGAGSEIQLVLRALTVAQRPTVLSRPGAADVARSLAEIAPVAVQAAEERQRHDGEDATVWSARILKALADEQLFSLLYQPIVDLSGSVPGLYEALLRMRDDNGAEYLPGSFMPAARQTGLMQRIDRWVLQRVIAIIRTESAQGSPPTLFVNLSRASLFDATFSAWLEGLLNTAGVAPAQLVLEINAADIREDLPAARVAMDALRGFGCALLLEGFDAASASADLLQQVRVDYVKIDRALVLDVARSEAHLERVRLIVEAATGAGVKTIAGYVQEADSVSRLWRCGVNYVQGYFLQHPSRALDYEFADPQQEVEIS